MTPGERLALDDAEQEVMQITQAQDENQSTGIRRPPTIEETETTLEAATIGFEFSGQPSATAEPGASTPPPEGDTGACCIEGECSILTEEECIFANGGYRGDGTDCDPIPCCCYFVISATGVGEISGVPFSCTLPETIVAFDNPCCDTHGSDFLVYSDCDDPDEPPGALTVLGSVIFNSTFPDEWEIQFYVGATGNISDVFNLGDSCVGGPFTMEGDAYPPTAGNSAYYTGSVQTFFGDCA